MVRDILMKSRYIIERGRQRNKGIHNEARDREK